jgi:hypothetical protein
MDKVQLRGGTFIAQLILEGIMVNNLDNQSFFSLGPRFRKRYAF